MRFERDQEQGKMPSERIQRQIDRLLDEAEQALGAGEWERARALCQRVLTFDPEDADAAALLAVAGRGLATDPAGASPAHRAPDLTPAPSPPEAGLIGLEGKGRAAGEGKSSGAKEPETPIPAAQAASPAPSGAAPHAEDPPPSASPRSGELERLLPPR